MFIVAPQQREQPPFHGSRQVIRMARVARERYVSPFSCVPRNKILDRGAQMDERRWKRTEHSNSINPKITPSQRVVILNEKN